MKQQVKSILWGVVLIAIGIVFALNAFGLTTFHIFFDGWWTLFLIVPCTIDLFTERDKTGSIIGLAIGIFLLLCCQDILTFDMVWKLLLPAIIIFVGVKLVVGGFRGKKVAEVVTRMSPDGSRHYATICATFSSEEFRPDNQPFYGADLTAVFGSVRCDLRNATIEKDCVIRVSAIFGGIEILVPEYVNIKTNSTSLFGAITNKTPYKKDAPTVYVTGTCLFGGTTIS